MRISDWSSDVCSADLQVHLGPRLLGDGRAEGGVATDRHARHRGYMFSGGMVTPSSSFFSMSGTWSSLGSRLSARCHWKRASWRSEEHTSELQSLMRNSYAVFCLKKKIYRDLRL